MNLLKHQTNEYFDNRSDHQFVFFTVDPIMRIAKIEKHTGNWWLTYSGMHIKAVTVKCVDFKELAGRRVQYYGYLSEKVWNLYPEIKGTIADNYALTNTAEIGVNWDKGISNGKIPSPWFWTNINDLLFL